MDQKEAPIQSTKLRQTNGGVVTLCQRAKPGQAMEAEGRAKLGRVATVYSV